MENKEKILNELKKEAEKIEIPESLSPEQMRERLKPEKHVENFPKKFFNMWKPVVLAACMCIIVGVVWFSNQQKLPKELSETPEVITESAGEEEIAEEVLTIAENTPTYEQIYASMNAVWKEREELFRNDMPAAATGMADGVVMESAAAEKEMSAVEENEKLLFGETNVQTAGVDEGDIVKNDGRYLYQIIQKETEEKSYPAIQIIDTKDGLKELSVIECQNSVEEMYVWEDLLVVIESGYLEMSGTPLVREVTAVKDVAYNSNKYHEISFYTLSDRTKPRKLKTFTLQGSYASSRIADGYFYGFSRYYAEAGDGVEDLDAYIPSPDGVRLKEDCIVLPEGSNATAYLVLVSIDLNNPTEFVQTAGIVTDSDLYYVSENSIYVTDYRGTSNQTGSFTDATLLMRFSYWDGKFRMEAEGEVPGMLNDTFSLDEADNHLRVVSTVSEYEGELMVDDRTGEEFGWNIEEIRQTNALYVFDQNLKMTGKIEGLAENEQIYSARFLGDTGYFVTFRQTDPLFAVDLTDPRNPKLLDELKVTGFSEYLHFYSKDRLLGIGMEADEETGQTEGMKLSMFDISDPKELEEISRKPLSEYDFSEALYNHKAVMISPAANLLGFCAEGTDLNGNYIRNYLVYSYENEEFVQKLKIQAGAFEKSYYTMRGTFIGDAFYLLCGNGTVKKYNLNNGELVESLNP